jgi:hypothetical protein
VELLVIRHAKAEAHGHPDGDAARAHLPQDDLQPLPVRHGPGCARGQRGPRKMRFPRLVVGKRQQHAPHRGAMRETGPLQVLVEADRIVTDALGDRPHIAALG